MGYCFCGKRLSGTKTASDICLKCKGMFLMSLDGYYNLAHTVVRIVK